MPLLDVAELVYHYRTRRGPVRAVDKISFSIDEGECLALVGESGCGKTSAATAILRLLPRNVERLEGRVLLRGQNIMELSEDEFRTQVRWTGISMVFQGAMNALSPTIRVGHQVGEPLVVHQNLSRVEAFEQAKAAFNQVRLPEDIALRYPHELSGGMKQRVVIAMALILRPGLVILDEPTSALDVMTQANIMNLLQDLKREQGLSFLFITHDLGLSSGLADSIAIMYAGRIVEMGSADDVYLSPRHPYTEKLLGSVPMLRKESAPDFIPGAPPDLVEPPAGCRFHPRCPYAFERCGWSAHELLDRLKAMAASGDAGLPAFGTLEAPEANRLFVGATPGFAPADLARNLSTYLRMNDGKEPSFRAVVRVTPARGGADVWMRPAEEPGLLRAGERWGAACWLLEEAGKR